MEAASFPQICNLRGERRKEGSGVQGSYGRDWKRAISTEVIKTPFLLKLAEESLAQLHPLNDIIVFNKSQFENPQRGSQ